MDIHPLGATGFGCLRPMPFLDRPAREHHPLFCYHNRHRWLYSYRQPARSGDPRLSGSDVVEVENFEIYSRWGEKVFQMQEFPPNDPQYGWNGVFRGQPMNIGHFTYFAQIRFVDGEVRLFKGGVNLVR